MTFRPKQLILLVMCYCAVALTSFAQPTINGINTIGSNPTNNTALQWNVVFNEPVTGVSTANFAVNAAGPTGTVSGVTPLIGNQTWTVTVSAVAGDGLLGLDLTNPAGITGGSGALVDTATGQTYLVDQTAPMVQSINPAAASPTSATEVVFAVTFSEPVYNVSPANFSPGGSLSGTVSSATTVDNIVWNVSVSGVSGSGTLGLDLTDTSLIIDAAGNPLYSDFAFGIPYTIDQEGSQYVCITRYEASPTSNSTVVFDLEFNEPTLNVTPGNLALNLTGPLSADIQSVVPDGDGTHWLITVENILGQGTIGLNLANSSGITDALGNPSITLGTGCESYVVDRVNPEIASISLDGNAQTSATTVYFFVDYTEDVTNPDVSDFTLLSGGPNASISDVFTSGSRTTVTVTITTGTGALCLQVNAVTTITDLLGNLLVGTPRNSDCFEICNDIPPVANTLPADGETTVTSADYISWTHPVVDQEFRVFFDGSFLGETTGTYIAIPGPLSPGQHSYVIEVDGSCSSGTEVLFNVLDPPGLVFPADGLITCLSPQGYQWETVDGATTYTLAVDGSVVTQTTSTQIDLGGWTLSNGPHTWTVTAHNEFGEIDSETYTFTVTGVDPVNPTTYRTDGTVYAVTVTTDTVYVGGEFSQIYTSSSTWEPRSNIAAFDRFSGSLISDWKPQVNGRIYALNHTTHTVLLGGDFTAINSVPVARIGEIDFSTTVPTTFRPGANASVRTIELVNDRVYYGGDFTMVNSQAFNFADPGTPAVRLAFVDRETTTGSTQSALINPNATVRDLHFDGEHLYVGGVFSQISGASQRGLARFSVPASGGPVFDGDFDLKLDLYVHTIMRQANNLYLGGLFNSVLDKERRNGAAINLGDSTTSFSLTSWNPRTDSSIETIASTTPGSVIYIGGTFTQIRQQPFTHLAGVDPVFAYPLTCSFNAERNIYDINVRPEMAVNAAEIFVGGQSLAP